MAVADFPRDVFKAAKSTAQKKPKGSQADASGEGTPASPTRTDSASVATGDQPGLNDSKTDAANLVQSRGLASTSATSLAPSTSTASVGSSQPAGASAAGQAPSTPTTQKPPSAPSSMNPLEQAVGAGKSIETIVTTGFKTPMNFCMGLARGFRNAPKLYNDETIRPPEKVTGFASGVKVAGKEFGLGMFDGISGLVTQPLKGAEKEGAAGLIKGFGKGIGGLVFKPAAGKRLATSCLVLTADPLQLSGRSRPTQWQVSTPRSVPSLLKARTTILWHRAFHKATSTSQTLRVRSGMTSKCAGFP